MKMGPIERWDKSGYGDVKIMDRYSTDQELLSIGNIHQPTLKRPRVEWRVSHQL
jgi:hypothetical protein